MGKKEGIWIEINYNKERSPRSIGEYKDDLKIGKWVYFSLDGDTSEVYDYSTSTLIYSKYCKDIELDCPAIYIGGIENLITDVQEIASDYIESLKPRPVGVVEIKTNVSITIDTTGNVKDISFTDKTGKVYEDNISKLILKKSNLWIPGKQNGQLYESKILLPIRVRYNY